VTDTPPTRQDAHRGAETVAPNHLALTELIDRLKVEDPAKVLRLGFNHPHAYRGYYHDLAFELARSVTVGEMLAAAESAARATFQGWKGGDYTMGEWTPTWLVTEEGDCGESLGAVLLEYMLADVLPGPVSQ
jgi:hypothetical protein